MILYSKLLVSPLLKLDFYIGRLQLCLTILSDRRGCARRRTSQRRSRRCNHPSRYVRHGSTKAIIQTALAAFKTEQIHILVNNAGAGDNKPLEDVTLDGYTKLMDVNVRAVIFMTQAVLPFLPQGGRIVNLSSISARGGYATQSVYAATKAAVEGLTRVWATELGHKYGVTVNAINPGPVDTDMYQAAGPVHLARMEEQNKKVPAGQRCGTVEDIGDIVTFLSQERSRWVTGDVICANGGMLYT